VARLARQDGETKATASKRDAAATSARTKVDDGWQTVVGKRTKENKFNGGLVDA